MLSWITPSANSNCSVAFIISSTSYWRFRNRNLSERNTYIKVVELKKCLVQWVSNEFQGKPCTCVCLMSVSIKHNTKILFRLKIFFLFAPSEIQNIIKFKYDFHIHFFSSLHLTQKINKIKLMYDTFLFFPDFAYAHRNTKQVMFM